MISYNILSIVLSKLPLKNDTFEGCGDVEVLTLTYMCEGVISLSLRLCLNINCWWGLLKKIAQAEHQHREWGFASCSKNLHTWSINMCFHTIGKCKFVRNQAHPADLNRAASQTLWNNGNRAK